MITVGFCNLKGGVGKTTACQNMAVALARLHKRVAVMDMDPQANLSTSFGIEVTPEQLHIVDFLTGSARWDEVVLRREEVDIVPGTLDLVMVELHPEGQIGRDTLLKEAVENIDPDRYDFLFFDSPPQLGIFTRNVLAAAKHLVIPMDGGFYSLAGLKLLNEAIPLFRERLNPDLSLLGVLFTRHSPNVFIYREVAKEVRSFFGSLLFEAYIRQNISLTEAGSLGVSIFSYDLSSNGARDYERVAREFLRRCNIHD
ncbi:MAG: ParA family protein [Synergistaceae bacterium]|jgi:chromosome partitioning protein|nr:ParA family protein [Synergistaceae bacterium]